MNHRLCGRRSEMLRHPPIADLYGGLSAILAPTLHKICDSLASERQFQTTNDQIVSHNARTYTLLFIMNIGSAIFKLNAPFSDGTFIHHVVSIHFTKFFANKKRMTDRTSQLAGFLIAAHILKLIIEKNGQRGDTLVVMSGCRPRSRAHTYQNVHNRRVPSGIRRKRSLHSE
ncbi:hypothetical protein QTP88_020261 [Uroleucon formosanum]